MRKTSTTSFWHRLFRSRMLLIVELCLVVLFSIAMIKEVVRRWEIRREITRLEEQISSVKQNNTELTGLITYFQSDYYKEREARLKLGLQKDGEKAITIPGLGGATQLEDIVVPTTESLATNADLSLPVKWWNYFFNK